MERCFSHSLSALKGTEHMLGSFFVRFFCGACRCGEFFLKKAWADPFFPPKQVYFHRGFFGLLLMKKGDWFRWMVFMVFSHGNAFIFAREFEKFLSIEMFSEGCLGSEKWVGGSFSVFSVNFSNLFLNYFFGGKPVFARVTRFFEGEEKNKSEIYDKKGLTLLKNRL